MQSVFCANKPYGISSHQTDPGKPGFVEWLSAQKQQPALLCHRLDKITTGCFVATTSPEDCAAVSKLWSEGAIHKVYWFITDKKPQQPQWEVASPIDGKSAKTTFRILKNDESFYLIEATPMTGRTHQIRIHAQESKTPLLGDVEYHGTPFPLTFLHCLEIRSDHFQFQSPPPIFYDQLSLLKKPLLCQWLMSLDRRKRLYPELLTHNQCVRLIHNEGTPLRVDLLGDVAHAGWWRDTEPSSQELQALEDFFSLIGISQWSLQNYGKNRDSLDKFFVDRAPETWTASENQIQYEFSKSVGAAPGLFLDQRNHRRWVQNNSKNKKVLNLFAYTGGFSLNAAKGEASEVFTVDLSPKYKQWAQKNFRLNLFESHTYKFYDMDSFDYLQFAKKKNLLFDLIICDPPSFSRNKKDTFQIDRDFKKLIEMCLERISSQGHLLFSTNFEEWTAAQWELKLKSSFSSQDIEINNNFSMQWDFDWHPVTAQMKAFHFKKK